MTRNPMKRSFRPGWLAPTLLLACLSAGCGIAGIASEPRTAADCEPYLWHKKRGPQCTNYVAARDALAAGRLDDAERKLTMSGLSNEPFAADFKAQVEAARKRAKQADSFDVSQAKGLELKIDDDVCPGRHQVGVVVLLADGSRKETYTDSGQKAGFIDYSSLEITVKNAEVDAEQGVIITQGSLAAIEEGYLVSIAVKGHPDVKAEKVVLPRLSCMGSIVTDGARGSSGSPGQSGESMLRNECKGRRGGEGSPGQRGEHGTHAGPVDIEIGYKTTKLFPKLIAARMGSSWYFAPANGKIDIHAIGGDGGNGGSGGQGGSGESPHVNCNGTGPSGEGGRGGNGGDGGDGGDGGAVTIRYEASSPELEKAVSVDTSGGQPGSAGQAGSAGATGNGGFETRDNGQPGQEGRRGRKGAVSFQAEAKVFQ